MKVDSLIHSIVRQTTILIAQLATSQGIRAPLAQIANQVFVDLAKELERQHVSGKLSADMFGLGLRTYQRKIQRLSESTTERGRSLWEVMIEYLRARDTSTQAEILERFARDEESRVKAVLHDLCESQLVVSTGAEADTTYRAVEGEELIALQQGRGSEGLDDLVLALIFREAPLPAAEIARRARLDTEQAESVLARLLREGRVERREGNGEPLYEATELVVPLGAKVGWEAAMFDHFKAVATTLMARLREDSVTPTLADRVGGSTYTFSVWPDHPLADEVYGTLGRLRAELSDLRKRVTTVNQDKAVPDDYTQVVVYLGQCLVSEDNESPDDVADEG